MQSETGTVKWYDATKKYGFIQPTENDASHKSKDVFIHMSELGKAGIKTLKEGQKISYNVESKDGRTSAIDIKLI